jgi:DNA-binding response OmpR family regulator
MRQEEVIASQEQLSTKTILIIEDDEAIGEVMALALQEEPCYRPLLVADGEAALALLSNHPIHLLLIDYHLATTSGLDIYDRLQTHQTLQAVPVIIISASLEQHEQELRQRGLLGLSKPFDVDDLLRLVKQTLG